MNKIILSIAIAFIALMSCEDGATSRSSSSTAEDLTNVTVDTDSESEKFSYSLGMNIGNQLKNNEVDSITYDVVNRVFDDSENQQLAYMVVAQEFQSLLAEEVPVEKLNQSVLKKAIYDVLEGDTTQMTSAESNTAYRSFLESNNLKVGERNLDAGKNFLEENKAKEGVQVTDSGLQYQLIEEGSGEKLTGNDVALVDFTGKSIGGSEFVNTADQGQPIPVDLSEDSGNVTGIAIPGLVEGLKLFPAGSSFRLFIPSNLAFGNQRLSEDIGPNSTVIFDIEDVQPMPADQRSQFRQQMEQRQQMMQRMQQQQMQQQGAQ